MLLTHINMDDGSLLDKFGCLVYQMIHGDFLSSLSEEQRRLYDEMSMKQELELRS